MTTDQGHLQPGTTRPFRIQCPGQCRSLDRSQTQLAQSNNVIDRDDQVTFGWLSPRIDRSVLFGADASNRGELDPRRGTS